MDTRKSLILKNKNAFDNRFYIESYFLSYLIINKSLAELCRFVKIPVSELERKKLGELVKILEKHCEINLKIKRQLKKSTLEQIKEFNKDYKAINQALRHEYAEQRIIQLAKKGLIIAALVNTRLTKIKHT